MSEKARSEAVDIEYVQNRERDLLFGLILVIGSIALGVYGHIISVAAVKLMDVDYYTAPGFLLVMISIGVLVMAIYLMIHARAHGASFTWVLPKNLIRRLKDGKAATTVLVFFYLFMYMVVLWGNIPFTKIRIPFWINTMIFMMVLMFTFKVTKPRNIILISVLTSVSVHVVFKHLIGVALP